MKIKIILLLIVLYLGALLITLPAQQAVRFIPVNSGIKFGVVSGTLWNGKANQVAFKKQFHLKQLTWQVDWSALLSLHLKVDVKFDNGVQALSGKGSVLSGFSGISIENLIADISAPELLTYTGITLPAEVDGNLSLVIKNAQRGFPYCQQLDGFVVWEKAGIHSEFGNVDLKSAHADLSCDNGQIVANIKQSSDQLISSATFTLQDKGIYQLQGLLKPSDKLDPAISGMFSWIGAKNKAGETPVKFTGRL